MGIGRPTNNRPLSGGDLAAAIIMDGIGGAGSHGQYAPNSDEILSFGLSAGFESVLISLE
jgi:hypothetical protein